jgi:hypothetical protein
MLAAEIQYETLTRSLLIAFVVVAPYGIYKVRQVRAARRAVERAAAAANEPPPPDRPRLEDVIDRISALGEEGADTSTLTVPPDVTVGGSEPPPGLVDSLVRDALRRSGLIATAEIDTPDGRVIEFRRSEP